VTGLVLQAAFALGVVLLLVLVLAFAAGKRRSGAGGVVALLSYLPLGPRRGVAALGVGRRVLIVGITGTDLRLLASLAREEVQGTGEGISDAVERLRRIRERLDG